MTIVPTTKLIVLAAVVFLPVAILVAVLPAATVPGVGLAVVLVIVAAADAAVSRGLLTGVRVIVQEVMRISAGREGEMTLSIENTDTRIKRLRLGLAFPRQVYSPDRDLVTDLPTGTTKKKNP